MSMQTWKSIRMFCAVPAKKTWAKNFSELLRMSNNKDEVISNLNRIRISTEKKNIKIHPITYHVAIKKCFELREYQSCWKIYRQAKYHSCLDTYIYNIMFETCIKYDETKINFGNNSNNMYLKMNKLYHEMTKDFNIKPSIINYCTLIHGMTKYNSWKYGIKYWNEYLNNKELSSNENNIKDHVNIYCKIIYLYIAKKDIKNALKLFVELMNKYDDKMEIKYNNILNKIFSGFSSMIIKEQRKSIGNNVDNILYNCEKLFNYLYKNNKLRKNDIQIFNSVLNIYASKGDMDSCMDIIKFLMNDENFQENSNGKLMVDHVTFNTCLKCLIYMEIRNEYYIFNLVNDILKMMKENNIDETTETYAMLFHLCGKYNNIDKAINYYIEMNSNNIIPSKQTMYGLLKTGLIYYSKEEERLNFVQWWISECNEYRIKSSLSVNELVHLRP